MVVFKTNNGDLKNPTTVTTTIPLLVLRENGNSIPEISRTLSMDIGNVEVNPGIMTIVGCIVIRQPEPALRPLPGGGEVRYGGAALPVDVPERHVAALRDGSAVAVDGQAHRA